MTGERALSEAVGGPRCHHDMIAAWCSWCLGHDETLALSMQREEPRGVDLLETLRREASGNRNRPAA